MNHSETLKDLVIDALDERKALEVVTLDVRNLTDITDYMVIASGRSTRQVQSLAENVLQRAKEAGFPVLGTEGMRHGEWALIDLTDVVVHVMLPDTRELYQLEKLWGDQAREALERSRLLPDRTR